tara:strand:- start:143 stop:466 length:324 start_codon:yes stop_codon:yes gene_type:complete
MKLLIALIITSFTFSAYAGYRTKFFTHYEKADTHELVMEKIEDAIPLIQAGRITSVWQDGCRPNNTRTIKIRNVAVKKYYRYDRNGQLVPYFKATITYSHNRCFEGR